MFDLAIFEPYGIDIGTVFPDFRPDPPHPFVQPGPVFVFAEEFGPMLPPTGPRYAALPDGLGDGVGALGWNGERLVDL